MPGRYPMSRAGVLLDRDGTIIVDHGYVGSPDRVEFVDGAIEAIAALNESGIPVAVVTNQAGVSRGFYDLDDVRRVHDHIDRELAGRGAHIDLWLFCPYHPDGSVADFARGSADRKPGPGMALAAAERLDLDLTRSWVVGDRDSDVGLALAVGARPILLGQQAVPGVTTVPDLVAATRLILEAPGPETIAAAQCTPPDFPAERYDSVAPFAQAYTAQVAAAVTTVDAGALDRAAKILNAAYDLDAGVFACGNGGSASIANHLQCDHVKGVRTGTDLRTRVISLSTNMEIFSAIANDLGYDRVFEFQLESQARPGDVLVAISSSGSSPNIVRALEWARNHGLYTIALTGFSGLPSRDLADVSVHVDCRNYGVVEDAHQVCMHLLAQYVRQSRLSSDAVAAQVF